MSDEDSGFKVRSQGRLITNPTGPALFKGDVNPGDPGVITVSDELTGDISGDPPKFSELGLRMVEMLRRLEYGGDDGLCCICRGFPEKGHSPDCDLHVLLRDLP